MSARRGASLAALALLLAAAAVAAAPSRVARRAPATPIATVPSDRLGGVRDSGVFIASIAGHDIGLIAFHWRIDGSFESRTVRGRASLAGMTCVIEPDSTGAWRRIVYGEGGESAEIVREGGKATLRMARELDTLVIEPGMVLHGPPALMAQAVRAYAAADTLPRRFPALFLPMHAREATLQSLGRVRRVVGGRRMEFRRYRYAIAGTEYILWLDAPGRLCFAEDPGGGNGFVRQGFEALRGATGPSLAAPRAGGVPAPARGSISPGRDSLHRP